MGNWLALHFTEKDFAPNYKQPPTFDTNEGFPGQRKERVKPATLEEMRSCRIAPKDQGYCAHKLIALKMCKLQNAPFFGRCKGVHHAYVECEKDDYYMRMMEYERERRLLKRKRDRHLRDIDSQSEIMVE